MEMLTYHEGDNVDISNVTIHRIQSIPGINNIKPGPSGKKIICDMIMFLKCLKILHNNHFDLVHAVEESVFIAMVMKWLFGIPFVYDMDSLLAQQVTDKYKMLRPIRGLLESFENMAIRRSSGVLAVCKSLQKRACDCGTKRPVVCLEDVSLLDIPHLEQGNSLPESLGSDGPVVMYVGNLEEYQGIDLLLESFQQLTHRAPTVQLVIIGGDQDSIEKYKDRSRQLQIQQRVSFLGQRPVSQLGFYLDQADILVSPRIYGQNTPMKIFSYLDSGKPLLATRLSMHTQVLDDQIALLAKPEQHSMTNGLMRLLEDPDFAGDLAIRAKERARQRYSYKMFRANLLKFYKTLEMNISHPRSVCGATLI